MVTVKVEGEREIRVYLDKIQDGMEPALRRAVQLSLARLKSTIVRDKLSGQVLQRRSGALAGSIFTRLIGGGDIGGMVGTNKIYAAIHEFGGIIRAKRADFLKFQIDGSWVQVKQVRMPARPYMQPAFHENISRIEQIFAREIEKVIK
ncbi:MAG: phage virion morphogenesis protein [Candidatus Zixiibacteriota bacterium]|nr:MAG: phage virion morphogenesis protein [candidate division Zixibacteria bacterium]